MMETYDRKVLEGLLKFMSYKPKYVLLRLLAFSLLGLVVCRFSINISDVGMMSKNIFDFFPLIILSFGAMSEANLAVIHVLNRFEKTRWNIFFLPIGMAIVSGIIIYLLRIITKSYLTDPELINHTVFKLVHSFVVVLVFIMYFLIIIIQLTKRWMESQKEIDDLKSAKLQSDYNSLQDRLNPHFLFNNLSVLKSLIRYDTDSADRFIENFTDVYRYVLKSRDHKTISVYREMDFVNAYMGLQGERLGEGVKMEVELTNDIMECEVPPMAIQALVENAIKHNRASRKKPLMISIKSKQGAIEVRNNLDRKETTYSTQTGMKTLRMQYELLGGSIKVEETKDEYAVEIPVL